MASTSRWRSALEVPLGKDDPGGATRACHRRPRAVPGDSRQLRAGGAARCAPPSGAGSTAQPTRVVPGHQPRAPASGRRTGAAASSRCRWTAKAIELFVAARRAQQPEFVLDADNRAAGGRDRAAARWPAAGHRARGGAHAACCRRAQLRRAADATASRLLGGARGAARARPRCARRSTGRGTCSPPWEQAALAQCSVFEGGFTLEAAEAVLDLSRWPRGATDGRRRCRRLSTRACCARGLPVEQSRYGIDEPYFGMYLSIHEYAAREAARASGARANTMAAEQRHGRYFARFGGDDAICRRCRATAA